MHAEQVVHITAEMLPPESNPERRQVKVNSRHRLHHAAELPALGQAGNMVFCAYISPAGGYIFVPSSPPATRTALRCCTCRHNLAAPAVEHPGPPLGSQSRAAGPGPI